MLWLAAVACAASPVRMDAPVDLVGTRSRDQLAHELQQTRDRVAPKVEDKKPERKVPIELEDYGYWGELAFSLNLRESVDADPRELETTFTLPRVLSLYSADVFFNLKKDAFGFFELRNIFDSDSRGRLFIRDPGVFKVDFRSGEWHFFEFPPQARDKRVRNQGEIEMSHKPLFPIRLAYDLQSVNGLGALSPRSWDSRELRFEAGADLLVADALLTIPLQNYHDDLLHANDTYSNAFILRLGSPMLGTLTNLGFSRYYLHNAAVPDVEWVTVMEATTLSRNPFHIRGLETRARYKLELHRDQISRLGRTKENYETYSVMTYRRNRRLTLEMGGATRKVHHMQLDRRGIDLVAVKPGASRNELAPFTQEEKPLVTEGWMGVSYRGIPNMNVNLRMDTAGMRNQPPTDFGGVVQPSLYPDNRGAILADLVYRPYSPHWGAALKIKNETRHWRDRATEVEYTLAALTYHVSPFPLFTVTSEVALTQQDSKNADVANGQSDSQSYDVGMQYEASPTTNAFADFTHVVSSGALAAKDYLVSLGLEAAAKAQGSWRVMVSRERLKSTTAGVVPFIENQVTAMRRLRF